MSPSVHSSEVSRIIWRKQERLSQEKKDKDTAAKDLKFTKAGEYVKKESEDD